MNSSQWLDYEYLAQGNLIQVEVYHVLKDNQIFDYLQAYHPILVGTVPIAINVAGSDLDIICEVHNFEEFEKVVRSQFSNYAGFVVTRKQVAGLERIKANFRCDDWAVEIFGQPIPTRQQNGFRHMVVEARMLELYGDVFKEQIIQLKSQGIKTEPAFAERLRLEGDPYETLLDLYHWNDSELMELWNKCN